MKEIRLAPYQYAVIRLSPVAMVEHFKSPAATAKAKELELVAKKYLV